MTRRIMWVLAIILGIALLAALGLWLALRQNAPAVLDTIDRVAGPTSGVEIVHTASTGPAHEQRVIVYRQEGADEPLPVFLFFHGGAWAHGDPDDYGFIPRNIAPEGYVAVLGGYRMNEEGRYPAMVEDTADAIRWVYENIADYGGDPRRIVLSGHSAGAYNIVQAVMDERYLAKRGVPQSAIAALVPISGPFDFYPFDTIRSRDAFETVGAGPESQPVNLARKDAPPMLLVHGEADTVVRIRNSRGLEKALSEAGAPVETLYLPGASHNDPLLALTNPWRRDPQVFDRVTHFMARHTQVSDPVQAAAR